MWSTIFIILLCIFVIYINPYRYWETNNVAIVKSLPFVRLLGLTVVIVSSILYLIFFQTLNYWKKRNVPHIKPLPLLGNMAPFIFKKKSVQELFKDIYDEFPNERFSGCHLFLTPALIIRDLDLIKQIAIKDFDYFTDHALFPGNNELEPILSKSLVALTGDNWRHMRATLSPSYTNIKMKFMFSLMAECAEEFKNYFQKQSGIIEVEMKNVFTRITVDCIATTAFGVKVDSMNDPNNDFYVMAKRLIQVDGLMAIRLITYVAFPSIMKLLGLSAIPSKYGKYFTKIMTETVTEREKFDIMRPDMVHLFLEGRKNGKKSDLSIESMTAQAIMFFVAGAMNTTTIMSFMSYELATHPEIQQKLQHEIDQTLKQCDGKLTYEILMQMKYLDMVLSETLRKWPAGAMFDRSCVRDYVIEPTSSHEEAKLIVKGTIILFPYGAIQNDPKYFPEPTKFDPERFNEENKPNIVRGSYIPFGVGPRHCIGDRLAVMEIKIMFCFLLSEFDLIPTKRTPKTIIQSKLKLNLGADIWIGIKQRTSKAH